MAGGCWLAYANGSSKFIVVSTSVVAVYSANVILICTLLLFDVYIAIIIFYFSSPSRAK